MNKQEARGLAKIAGWIFIIIGGLMIIKGFLDMFILPPISEFVLPANWKNFALFEIVYGLACVSVGMVIFKFIRKFLSN